MRGCYSVSVSGNSKSRWIGISHTFALLVANSEHSSDSATNISTLSNIPITEAQLNHKSIHNAGNILNTEVLVQWRLAREGIARQGRNNNVERERLRSISFLKNRENREKLEETAWPAVKEYDRNSIRLGREQACEVNIEIACRVLDGYGPVVE